MVGDEDADFSEHESDIEIMSQASTDSLMSGLYKSNDLIAVLWDFKLMLNAKLAGRKAINICALTLNNVQLDMYNWNLGGWSERCEAFPDMQIIA